jgi:hypothetical protein
VAVSGGSASSRTIPYGPLEKQVRTLRFSLSAECEPPPCRLNAA